MDEGHSVITRKGQVTIPARIRRALNLEEGDRVTFRLEDGVLSVSPRESVVERTKGIFKGSMPYLTAEELRAAAEDAWVEDALERLYKKS